MDKLTKEEIREAANNFFCSPEGRPLTIDEAAELICTVDAFEAGVEWAEEKYAQQFERPDNDSGQGWKFTDDELKKLLFDYNAYNIKVRTTDFVGDINSFVENLKQ